MVRQSCYRRRGNQHDCEAATDFQRRCTQSPCDRDGAKDRLPAHCPGHAGGRCRGGTRGCGQHNFRHCRSRKGSIPTIEAAQRAIELDPNYADAHALNALILNYGGFPEKAEASLKTAIRLNPRVPATYLGILGEIRLVQRRFDEASALFESVLEINPNYSRIRMLLAIALVHAGFQDRAEWEAAELLVLLPDITLSRLEFSFPYMDPRDFDVMLDGLRAAGVPDQ